jgi:proteasome accessory factor B
MQFVESAPKQQHDVQRMESIVAQPQHRLYLVAFSRDHDEVRHFKVDRMTEAEATTFPFPWPEDFDLTQHLAGSFGIFDGRGDVTVRVRFLPRVARYVQESQWHSSQQLAPQPDGTLLAEFRLSNTAELKSWLLSFGRHALVLEPESLGQEMTEEAAAMLTLYRTDRNVSGTQMTEHRKKRKF